MYLDLCILIQIYMYICILGVFSVTRRKGATCAFKNVANPRLHLTLGNGNLLGAVCSVRLWL